MSSTALAFLAWFVVVSFTFIIVYFVNKFIDRFPTATKVGVLVIIAMLVVLGLLGL